VAELESLLEDSDLRDEAIEAIRSMMEGIVVTPPRWRRCFVAAARRLGAASSAVFAKRKSPAMLRRGWDCLF